MPQTLPLADHAKVQPGGLPFKETRGAFEYACQFLNWPPVEACQQMLAIIEDAEEIKEAAVNHVNQTAIARYGTGNGTAKGPRLHDFQDGNAPCSRSASCLATHGAAA